MSPAMLIAFTSPSIPIDGPGAAIALAGAIAIVFLVANAFAWLADSASARKLTEQLRVLQEYQARDDA